MTQLIHPLDSSQYTRKEIEKYEAVYGRDFVSPGGLASARQFCAQLDLQPGMWVLDVGCGMGGSAFHMVQQHGVYVDGIDLSANMLAFARERRAELGLTSAVNLLHGDILDFQPSIQYDRIHSRDVFLHIHDKVRLFARLHAVLAAGGKLLFTDYCCGEGEKSADFAGYVQQRDYALCTVAEYRALLQQAGFRSVMAEDCTAQFIDILTHELAHLATAMLDEASRAELVQSWQRKRARAVAGEQCWGLFQAER